MITIKLSFFASLQEDFEPEQFITLKEPIRLIQLFSLFKSKNGKISEFYFLESARFKSDFILLINGRNMYAFDGLNSIITKNCEISIFPLIGGGYSRKYFHSNHTQHLCDEDRSKASV